MYSSVSYPTWTSPWSTTTFACQNYPVRSVNHGTSWEMAMEKSPVVYHHYRKFGIDGRRFRRWYRWFCSHFHGGFWVTLFFHGNSSRSSNPWPFRVVKPAEHPTESPSESKAASQKSCQGWVKVGALFFRITELFFDDFMTFIYIYDFWSEKKIGIWKKKVCPGDLLSGNFSNTRWLRIWSSAALIGTTSWNSQRTLSVKI